MSKEIGFSVADDIREFADFYADQHMTTPSAMAKKGMLAEMKRHPLHATQIEEYERLHGKVPNPCVPVRARTGQALLTLTPNSLNQDQEAKRARLVKKSYAEAVEMTEAEHSALIAKYGDRVISAAIDKVAAQQIKTGKRYPSPRGAILQWGIRAVLEDDKRANPKGDGIKREAAPAPVCDVCGKPCSRDHGYWSCVEHGRRENVG